MFASAYRLYWVSRSETSARSGYGLEPTFDRLQVAKISGGYLKDEKIIKKETISDEKQDFN